MNFYRFYTHHHVLEPSFSRISTTLQTTKFERQKAWPATRHSIGQDRSIFLAVSHQATTSPLGGSAEVRTAMSVISDAEARNLWRNGRAKRSDLDEQHQLRQVGEKIEVEDGAWHEQGAGGVSKQRGAPRCQIFVPSLPRRSCWTRTSFQRRWRDTRSLLPRHCTRPSRRSKGGTGTSRMLRSQRPRSRRAPRVSALRPLPARTRAARAARADEPARRGGM